MGYYSRVEVLQELAVGNYGIILPIEYNEQWEYLRSRGYRLTVILIQGDVIKYRYSFNLYYYPPRDYFNLDILVGIRDVLIRIPRRYGENVRISVDEDKVVLAGYGLMGSDSVKVSVSKKYNVVHGILLAPPGILQIPIQIQL